MIQLSPVHSLPDMDDDPLVVPLGDGVDRGLDGLEVPLAIDVNLNSTVGADLLRQ